MKQLFRTLTLFALPLIVAACNTDYNFDNISLEVTVGDTEGIAIPIGSIGEIKLETLLKDVDIETGDDGFYGYSFNDRKDYYISLGTIDPISDIIPALDPFESSFAGTIGAESMPSFSTSQDLAFPEGLSGNLTLTDEILNLTGNTFSINYAPHTFEGDIELQLPAEVAAIKQITFGENGAGSIFELKFDLGGLADVCQSCTIDRFAVELPAGFTLATVEGDQASNYATVSAAEGSNTNNHYQIDNYTMSGNELTIDILIKSADLQNAQIGEQGMLTISEDVTFELAISGTLKAGTITATSPSVSILAEGMTLHHATIVTNEVALDFSFDESIQQEIEIPEGVTSLDYLKISKVGSYAELPLFSLDVVLEGAPVESIELREVEISLPAFLDIDTPEGWNYSNGVLQRDKLTLHNDRINGLLEFAIRGVESLPIVDGKVTLDSNIGINAKVYLAEGTELDLTTTAQNFKLTPSAFLDDIAIVSVSGHVEPDFSEYLEPFEFDLSKFTSELDGLDMDLNLQSPVLRLSAENPIGVGLTAVANITAYKGGDVVGEISSSEISILPAGVNAVTTDIVLVDSEHYDMTRWENEEVSVATINGLVDMVALLPEKIVIELDVHTSPGTHIVILQEDYRFSVKYAIEVPLVFNDNEDGQINYTVTIDDVDLSMLADVDVIVESIMLNVESESTLPVDLTMSVELLDENDERIECVTSSSEGCIAGSNSDEPKLSECALRLNIETPAAESSKPSPFAEIARTKKVRCHLEGKTLAGGGLKPEQYITAKLSLLLEEGITVDLSSLLPEETPDEEGTVE